ncbi:right-handed parallel beta-helix repeat-containing protein [bacterium]|nr:right-handed parallel beta-helix repeat-containing protein [bacterium]
MIICHEDLYSSSWYNKLYSLKVNQGYSVTYIEIEDGYGVGSIQFVIDDFDPDYVLLVGDASEYPDGSKQVASASNGNYIPFYYTSMYCTAHPNRDTDPIPNDEWFVENSPGTYIGRVPANSAQEVENWVDKLIEEVHSYSEYEDWKNNILFTTGNMDHPSNGCKGIYRNLERDTLIARYIEDADFDYDTLNSANYSDPYGYSDDRSDDFEDAVNTGCGFINAFGVGADEIFLVNFYFKDSSDWDFTNSGEYPFLLGMSCYVGRIQDYYNNQNTESIIQKLMFLEDAGIVNSIAPTWATVTSGVREFCYEAFEGFFQNDYQNLGKVLKQIKSDFVSASPRNDWMSKSVVLYGDPSAPLPVYQYFNSNITQNTEWSGSIIVENDISVASGVTLTIQPGTGIFFKDNAQLKVYGTLIAEGTVSYPIVFSGASESPSRGDWDGIRFEDSSDDANCIINHCEIEYAYFGIYCNYANPTIENNTISNCKYGLYLRYSSPDISTNSIRVNQYYGIYGYQSNSYIYDNLIENNSSYGAYFVGSSTPEFYNNSIQYNYSNGFYLYLYCNARFGPISGSGKGNNVIYSNAVYGIRAYYNCYPFMGSSDAYNNRIGGYNSIYGNISYDGYVSSSCSVEAEWNYWDDPQNIYIGSGCSFDITPALASNDASGSSLAKTTGNIINIASVNPDYEKAGFNPRKPNPNRLSDLWLWGHDLFINDKPETAVEVYQTLIRKFPNSEEARKALIIISQLYSETGRNDLGIYLREIINDKDNNNSLKQVAYDMLAAHYYQKQDFENGIQCSRSILEQYPDTESEKLALFQIVTAYYQDLSNRDQAQNYLDKLQCKYPNDHLSLMAREAMGEEINWALFKPTNEPETAEIVLPDKYTLRNNYPNPFNPTTTIAFDLPEESHVTLIIYDISGREIVKIVDGNLHEGFRHAVWDGKDKSGVQVSSGVYLYSIRTSSGFNATKKMVLVR